MSADRDHAADVLETHARFAQALADVDQAAKALAEANARLAQAEARLRWLAREGQL